MTSDVTLRQDVYTQVYNLLNTDKSGYGASTTPILNGGYPDLDNLTFPSINIPNININKSDFSLGSDNNTSKSTISVVIYIFAKKNIDLDKLSDGIDNSILTKKFDGFVLVDSSEDDALLTPNDQKVKSKTLSYTFIRR
jgi:hypothetical protein